MLTYKRALVVAAAVLTLFLILHVSHPHEKIAPLTRKSPKPTGSYSENRKVILGPDADTRLYEPTPVGIHIDETKRMADRKTRPQVPLEDASSKPLRQQLAYQFPYELDSKFPNYIWQTWKYSPSDPGFEEKFRDYEASWTEKHPGFVHEVITDSVAVHLINHLYSAIPEVIEAYHAMPLPVLKADFFRYLILLARGGIYSDIDTSAIQPAFDWVPTEVSRESFGMVVGIEADPDREDWAKWYSRRIQFCQWTIQSKPGHPVLQELVAHITEDVLAKKEAGTLDKTIVNDIVEFTGPALFTDKVFDYFNDATYFDMSTSKGNITWKDFTGITKAKRVGDLIVLPITSFSPGVGQMGAGDETDPMAFVKHNFEGTPFA